MERNTSNVSFYCRESKKNRLDLAPVELSIIINGERCIITLPRREYPELFKKEASSRKSNPTREYMDSIRRRLNDIEVAIQ